MASGTRSSKSKSSPSHSLKKKRRNKDRGKKRSKRKSKKVSPRESPDTSANDESLSDSSVSCSSADRDRRRSRSRIRNDIEQGREKSRRGSSKREKGKDTVKVRKSKILKRGRSTYAKRKRHGKMQRGKKSSISSSSGSLSCSTCESSDDSRKESERTRKGVKRIGRQRNRRSRSSSSCRSASDDGMRDYERIGKRVKISTDEDRCSSRLHSADDSYKSQERLLNENSSRRRLRSIIISKEQCEEESDMARDDQKGEIGCDDHDDYPPYSRCSNGGSIDGETWKEVSCQSNAVAGQIGYLEESNNDCYKETDDPFIINISKLPERGDLECDLEVSVLNDVRETLSTEAVSTGVSLESILRQKALENLNKFKSGGQANPNNPVKAADCKGKEQVMQNAVIELKKNDQAEGLGASSVPHQAKLSVVATSKAFGSTVSLNKEQIATDATRPLEESSFINSSDAKSLQPRAQDSKISMPSSGKGRVITLKKEKSPLTHGTTAEGPKMIPPTRKGRVINLKKGDLGADKFPVQEQPSTVVSAAQNMQKSQPNDPQVLVADKHEAGCFESDMLKTCTIDLSAAAQQMKHVESCLQSYPKMLADDDENKSSRGLSNLQGQSSDARKTEGEGSQFEQKTMSVIRGGEAVQVSYKVYIPKRTQALARRKLRR